MIVLDTREEEMIVKELEGKRVFLYTRLSNKEKDLKPEEIEQTIKNAIQFLEESAKENKCTIVSTEVDRDVKGSDRNRKGLNRILVGLKETNEADGILVKKDDRFCRSGSYQSDLLKDLYAYGKFVYSVMDHKFLSHKDLGDRIKSNIWEQNLYDQEFYTDKHQQERAKEGLPNWNAPFGYKNSNGRWIIDQKKAEIVRSVNEMLNQENAKKGYLAIITELNISKDVFYRIKKHILDGTYNGFCYGEKAFRDHSGKIIRKEPIKYKGIHTPIL